MHIGGLPLHFLFFPFGMAAQGLLLLPYLLRRSSSLPTVTKGKIKFDLRPSAFLIYLFCYAAMIIFAAYLPYLLSPQTSASLAGVIKSSLSVSPFLDGMWFKLSEYGRSYQEGFDQRYLYFLFIGVVGPSLLLVGLVGWGIKFAPIDQKAYDAEIESVVGGLDKRKSKWVDGLVFVLFFASLWIFATDFVSEQYSKGGSWRYGLRVSPLLPEDPSRLNHNIMSNAIYMGVFVHANLMLALGSALLVASYLMPATAKAAKKGTKYK